MDDLNKYSLQNSLNGPRKSWEVVKLFKGSDKSKYGPVPDLNDERWTNKGLFTKGKVYWVKIADSEGVLAFYLGSIYASSPAWYFFDKNEPISGVTQWIEV